jgi:hypothetical protein
MFNTYYYLEASVATLVPTAVNAPFILGPKILNAAIATATIKAIIKIYSVVVCPFCLFITLSPPFQFYGSGEQIIVDKNLQ